MRTVFNIFTAFVASVILAYPVLVFLISYSYRGGGIRSSFCEEDARAIGCFIDRYEPLNLSEDSKMPFRCVYVEDALEITSDYIPRIRKEEPDELHPEIYNIVVSTINKDWPEDAPVYINEIEADRSITKRTRFIRTDSIPDTVKIRFDDKTSAIEYNLVLPLNEKER